MHSDAPSKDVPRIFLSGFEIVEEHAGDAHATFIIFTLEKVAGTAKIVEKPHHLLQAELMEKLEPHWEGRGRLG